MNRILIIFIILIACSCKYQKLLKSSDYNLKYEKAVEYYNKKDYYRAQQLFEELVPITAGSQRGEEVYYYYAYCYYGQDDFIMAGYHFKNFTKTYPNSKHTEECEFLGAYCFYMESPEPELDQSNTLRAVDALQLFINKYPESDRINESNELIDKLRNKLEIKSYNSSRLYFQLGDYKAAIIALKNSFKDYPDTQYREDILYLIVKSCYLLADKSIETKKKERYQATIAEYYVFIDEFPDSKYRKEAEKMYESSLSYVKDNN
ncbi:MAG: outer membrane protein assembly factor BamD [Bacteroidia bacterium]|nr:outer membrane protein assembly factor BamD [Bacteroidia bacterium]